LIAFLTFGLFGPLNWSRTMRAEGVTPVQLVRLTVSAVNGSVRLEITADGPLADTAVERFARGRETVIRVHGARSLLRQAYAVGDELVARTVRTAQGNRNGTPFVDIVITRDDGDTFGQKKSFNRLFIGVDNELARSRRNATPASTTTAQTRRDPSATRSVSVASATVTDTIPNEGGASSTVARNTSRQDNPSGTVSSSTNQTPVQPVNNVATLPQQMVSAQMGSRTIETPQTFRGRSIYNATPQTQPSLARLNLSPFAPMFWQSQTQSGIAPQAFAPWGYVPMTLDAPATTPGAWIPGTSVAARDEVGGHAWAGGVLRPSFSLGATYDSNFFYRSQVGRDAGIFTLAPRLEFEIPGERNGLRIMYEAQIRRLSFGQWASGQKFDFDTRFELGSFVRLALRNHFVRSPLDPREYDPAGEVYIVGDTFFRNDGALRLEFLLNPRSRLAWGVGYNLVRWNPAYIESPGALFIDNDELYADATFERDISEQMTATAGVFFTNTRTKDPLRAQFDRFNDRYRYGFLLGGRTQITDTNGLAFRVGFERSEFLFAPPQNDYNTLIFDLKYRRDFTENVNFELAGLRKTQVSAFNLEGGNARLLSTGGAARVGYTPWEALKLGFGVNYQQLTWPLAPVADSTASGGVFVGNFAGEFRKDHLYGFLIDGAYRWSDFLGMRFGYTFARRDSTLPVFTYNRNRLSLIFELGRRNNARGRTF
jgi:hypothetical protein